MSGTGGGAPVRDARSAALRRADELRADVSALDAAVHNLTIALDQKDMLNESVIVFTTGTNRWNDRLIDSWVALPIWPVACLLAY